MTAPEAVEAVRGYLAHTGGSEERQIFLGLGATVSRPMIRKAVKTLACRMRVVGDWPRFNSAGEAVPARVWDSGDGRFSGKYVSSRYTPGKFTVYTLPA